MHVILFRQHGNQLITQDKSNNHPRNGNDHRVRKVLYQAENTAVPPLGRLSNLGRNLPGLIIDIGKHCRQVGRHHPGQEIPHPVLDCLKNAIEHT